MKAITERQRKFQDLRYRFILLSYRAREQGINILQLLKKPKGYMNKEEKLKFFIRQLNNALLEI